jgi:hypothetical protein
MGVSPSVLSAINSLQVVDLISSFPGYSLFSTFKSLSHLLIYLLIQSITVYHCMSSSYLPLYRKSPTKKNTLEGVSEPTLKLGGPAPSIYFSHSFDDDLNSLSRVATPLPRLFILFLHPHSPALPTHTALPHSLPTRLSPTSPSIPFHFRRSQTTKCNKRC